MVRLVRHMLSASIGMLLLATGTAYAQTGQIAGRATDTSGAALPGVLVEATSPALIEKVRSVTTDGNGRFQIINLPVGRYKVSFKLANFGTVEQSNIDITSDYTAPVNAEMKVGGLKDVVNVEATAGVVDVQNARQRQVITGEELRDLPNTRDLSGLANLVPGIMLETADLFASRPLICVGGAAQGLITGGQSGCGPMLGVFNSHSTMNDVWDTSLNRGRIQVDGMNIMGVGISTFADRDGSGGTAQTPYLADVQNASEITFTLSGGLGENETGGATINIIPRTGGNRYAGNYFLSYGDRKFYDKNRDTRLGGGFFQTAFNQLDFDYDNNGSFGGPIIKDRLWFQAGARYRGRQTELPATYYNRNEGIFGANYIDDRDRPSSSNEIYRNANVRLTLQATQKNKFNLFWDEQYTCSNPCEGTLNLATSPEAQASQIAYPLHVSQLNWTNPLTNKLLLSGGMSWNATHTDRSRNRFLPNYSHLPEIVEAGDTANFGAFGMTSGSINSGSFVASDRWEWNGSVSYVTGSHNAKIGYQGSFLSSVRRDQYNDLRMTYRYNTPGSNAGSCVVGLTPPTVAQAPIPGIINTPTLTWCGLQLSPEGAPIPNLNDDPASGRDASNRPTCLDSVGRPVCRFPVPTNVEMYIPMNRDERAAGNSLYIQDQWTLNRVTMNGAVRYDLATSHFNETCVGPDAFMGSRSFCLNTPGGGPGRDGQGVEFQEITPRWGVAWDVFGTGRTSVKWNMGRYAGGVGIGGIYTAGNPAAPGRTVNTFSRGWQDTDGDRVVDCNTDLPLTMPPAGGSVPRDNECLAIAAGADYTNYRRFGRSPYELDETGQALGLANIQCGRNDSTAFPQQIVNYCNDYFAKGGQSLITGWNKRQYEWQFGLGVQHEILPRMSLEVTYNKRWSKLQTISDQTGLGCDLYSNRADGSYEFGDPDTCMNSLHNWTHPSYDYYSVRAPFDPKLPNGGGYVIPGFIDRKPGILNDGGDNVTAQVLDVDERRISLWRGVDVNLTLRARGGLRITGGTSTGGSIQTDCKATVDGQTAGSFILREGREPACERVRPWQTNVRGTATYTIPWVDVLLSSTFSYRPGTQLSANYTYSIVNDLIWLPGSEYRTNTIDPITGLPYGPAVVADVSAGPAPGCSATVPVGCLRGVGGGTTNASTTVTQNLLSDDYFGEGIRLFDIKVAKNIRFGGKRVNFGVDIYNVFNSDGATGYCGDYPTCAGFGTPPTNWGTVNSIVSARYARFQMQFDF